MTELLGLLTDYDGIIVTLSNLEVRTKLNKYIIKATNLKVLIKPKKIIHIII